MKLQYEVETSKGLHKVWKQYMDITTWNLWEHDLVDISLSGEFMEGVQGTMKLGDQPEINFIIFRVDEKRGFTLQATIPHVGDLYFHHDLYERDGQRMVAHAVELKTLDHIYTKQHSGILFVIFQSVPKSVDALLEVVK